MVEVTEDTNNKVNLKNDTFSLKYLKAAALLQHLKTPWMYFMLEYQNTEVIQIQTRTTKLKGLYNRYNIQHPLSL